MIGLTRGVALGASLNRFVEIFGQYDNDEDGGKNNRVEHGFRADHLEKNNRREESPPICLFVQVVPISPSLATASTDFCRTLVMSWSMRS